MHKHCSQHPTVFSLVQTNFDQKESNTKSNRSQFSTSKSLVHSPSDTKCLSSKASLTNVISNAHSKNVLPNNSWTVQSSRSKRHRLGGRRRQRTLNAIQVRTNLAPLLPIEEKDELSASCVSISELGSRQKSPQPKHSCTEKNNFKILSDLKDNTILQPEDDKSKDKLTESKDLECKTILKHRYNESSKKIDKSSLQNTILAKSNKKSVWFHVFLSRHPNSVATSQPTVVKTIPSIFKMNGDDSMLINCDQNLNRNESKSRLDCTMLKAKKLITFGQWRN